MIIFCLYSVKKSTFIQKMAHSLPGFITIAVFVMGTIWIELDQVIHLHLPEFGIPKQPGESALSEIVEMFSG